jgi:hypothetical protein
MQIVSTNYSVRKSTDWNFVVCLRDYPDFVISGHYSKKEANSAVKKYKQADKRRLKK